MRTTSDTWKQRVNASFSKASQSYESKANVQNTVACVLADQMQQYVQTQGTILELGAGTGFLTRKLLRTFPASSITAVDLSSNMLEELQRSLTSLEKKRVFLSVCDMDTVESSEHSLVCSSFSLQWSKDPLRLLAKSLLFLTPGGFLAHAFPVKGSLLSMASRGYLDPIPSLSLSMESYVDVLESFDILSVKIFELREEFCSPLHALRHIKAYGGAISSSNSKTLYSLRRETEPVICEWCVGSLIARRKT